MTIRPSGSSAPALDAVAPDRRVGGQRNPPHSLRIGSPACNALSSVEGDTSGREVSGIKNDPSTTLRAGRSYRAQARGWRHGRRRGPGIVASTPYPQHLEARRMEGRSCIAPGASPGISNGIGHRSQGLYPGTRMDGPRCARACLVGGTGIPRLAPWAQDGRPLDGRGAWKGTGSGSGSGSGVGAKFDTCCDKRQCDPGAESDGRGW